MTSREDMRKYAQAMIHRFDGQSPIYRIILFENPDKEVIYIKDGKEVPSGFPDLGSEADMGFYYELEDAIHAMNVNACDIWETCYNAGFIVCHFPGLYPHSMTSSRMYFVYDEENDGFFQQEEPKIFKHISF